MTYHVAVTNRKPKRNNPTSSFFPAAASRISHRTPPHPYRIATRFTQQTLHCRRSRDVRWPSYCCKNRADTRLHARKLPIFLRPSPFHSHAQRHSIPLLPRTERASRSPPCGLSTGVCTLSCILNLFKPRYIFPCFHEAPRGTPKRMHLSKNL